MPAREAVEEGADTDARDRARERGARAHVRAVAERQVLLGVGAIDAELVGVVEHALVAVRRREAGDHALPDVIGQPPISTSRTQPRAMKRMGGESRRLSSIARPSASSLSQRALDVGIRQELVQQVAEQLARRREAARDQVAHQRAHLAERELFAVVVELEEPGEHVVGCGPVRELGGALGDVRVDVSGELGKRAGEALAALGAIRRGEGALHQALRPRRELRSVGGIESEQVQCHAVGELHGERGDQIGRRARDGVEEARGRRAHERLRLRARPSVRAPSPSPGERACGAAGRARRAVDPQPGSRHRAPSYPSRSRRWRCRARRRDTRRDASRIACPSRSRRRRSLCACRRAAAGLLAPDRDRRGRTRRVILGGGARK